MKGKVINFGFNNQYLAMEEETYEGRIFVLLVKVDNATGDIYKDKTMILEEKNVNGKLIVDKISEKEIEENMASLLLKKARM